MWRSDLRGWWNGWNLVVQVAGLGSRGPGTGTSCSLDSRLVTGAGWDIAELTGLGRAWKVVWRGHWEGSLPLWVGQARGGKRLSVHCVTLVGHSVS